MTLQEAFELYVTTRGKSLKASTLDSYSILMRLHLGAFRDRQIESISRAEILKHYEAIAATSPAVAKRLIALCAAVVSFSNAWNEKSAVNNFANMRRLKLLKPVPQRTRRLDEKSLPIFFSSLGIVSRDKQVLLLLLVYTGCRLREIGDLTWSEIDLDAGIITVPASRRKVAFDFRVVLSEVPLELLRKFWRENGSPKGSTRLFMHSAARGYQEILDATGIDARPHDLRRTHISIAGGLSIPDVIVKKLAGHTVSDQTAKYINLLDSDARAYNRRIVERLHELGGVKVETKEGKPRLKMSLERAKEAATLTVTLDKWSTQNAAIS